MPEEMESEDFNEKVLKKLNEHNDTKGVEFSTMQCRQRFFKKKTSIEIIKIVSCSHSLRCKNEEEVRHDMIDRSKRHTDDCKTGFMFKNLATTKKLTMPRELTTFFSKKNENCNKLVSNCTFCGDH